MVESLTHILFRRFDLVLNSWSILSLLKGSSLNQNIAKHHLFWFGGGLEILVKSLTVPWAVQCTEPFFSRLQKVFSALGRKYYIMLTINFCILAIYFGTHEYLEQNPILLLNSLMMCLKICEKFFWIIM